MSTMYSRSVVMLEQAKKALELLADTITDWEENRRYGRGVRTTVQTVQRIHNIYKSMNEAFLEMQEKNQG